jgi:hypothetical protein
MHLTVQTNNPDRLRFRLTVLFAVVLGGALAASLVFFAVTPQWTRRVIFFPQVNTGKFVAEVRYLPPEGSEAGDIRLLLEEILLGPSNFGNDALFSAATRLDSAMLEKNTLYIGFSKGIWQIRAGLFRPRERLQAVADALYFNFPWLENIRIFIDGNELRDSRALAYVDRKIELARSLVPLTADLHRLLRTAARHPLFSADIFDWDVYTFENGAVWDERILK